MDREPDWEERIRHLRIDPCLQRGGYNYRLEELLPNGHASPEHRRWMGNEHNKFRVTLSLSVVNKGEWIGYGQFKVMSVATITCVVWRFVSQLIVAIRA